MKRRAKKGTGKVRLGVHTSIAGGVSKSAERAAGLGCTTIQIFSHSPRQWEKRAIPEEEALRFRNVREEHDISPVFVHTSYLINLASMNSAVVSRSIPFLRYELENADILRAEYIVLHTGSASGDDGNRARGRAARSLMKAIGRRTYRAKILLENTAGEKGDITSSIRNLGEIINAFDNDAIGGICIDTCHAFASGYDLRAPSGIDLLLNEIDEHLGLERLRLIHVNDSKKPCGSGVDRHEHIGKGHIGLKGFRNLLTDKRIGGIPLILETPKKSDADDKLNLSKIRNLLKGKDPRK